MPWSTWSAPSTRAASPCSSSSTTCARSCRSPIASSCCPSGRRSPLERRARSPPIGESSRPTSGKSMSILLRLDRLQVGYGDMTAVHEATLEVHEGEVVALIGGNGAGKTTTLRAISGLLPLRAGSIEFAGERLDGLGSSQVVARGIAHVPEGRQLFPTMTVRDNLELGGRAADRRRRNEALETVFELFPRLRERERQLAGTLSGGEQQMCAIGRGLMARPRLLILDELSLGLAPIMLDVLVDALQRVHAEGTTVFVVEQDVATAFDLATTGYVLENGRVVLSGPTADLRSNPHVKKA